MILPETAGPSECRLDRDDLGADGLDAALGSRRDHDAGVPPRAEPGRLEQDDPWSSVPRPVCSVEHGNSHLYECGATTDAVLWVGHGDSASVGWRANSVRDRMASLR